MNITPIEQVTRSDLYTCINDSQGYMLCSMPQDDLAVLLSHVREQYLHVIQSVAPAHVAKYFSQPLQAYHQIYKPDHFEHAKVWSKPSRVFGPQACQRALSLTFCQHLKQLLGDFRVADEEGFGWPGVYWRLVRPGNTDIGPIHADKWFWDLGHGHMPTGYQRLKIWICLHAEPGKSGLRVVPESHKSEQWKYHGEVKNGMTKPVIDEREEDLDLIDLPLSSGQFVLFHDKLLHGGMPNAGETSRLSLEFTLLVPES